MTPKREAKKVQTLSKNQQEVLDFMKKGWELGSSMGFDSRCWLQKDGCGRGGLSKDVNGNTFYALYQRNLIEIKTSKFPLITYKLVEVPRGK